MSTQTSAPSTNRQQAEADLVTRGYGAFNAGDLDLLTKIMDENVSWYTPGRGMLAGAHKGRDATFGQFGKYVGETNGTFKAELKYVTADGDGHVVGVHRNTGERNGKTLDTDCCIVFEVKDGRVVSGREHFFDLANWDAFWS